MRYMMKQKFWSVGGEYFIKDESETDVYRVLGKPFSWGRELSFQDMAERELAFISQKLWSLMPKYEIYRDGEPFAEVVREFSWIKSKFTLDVPGPNDYAVAGSFWEHEYAFERLGQTVARVSKDYWQWTDTYGIEIVDGEDDIAILATCVVIDLVCHGDQGGD